MKKVFTIRTNGGKYVDKNCLYYDPYDKKVVLHCSDTYENSVFLYYEENIDANVTYLNEKAKEFNIDYTFEKEFVMYDSSD